jgi:hypothetical protein
MSLLYHWRKRGLTRARHSGREEETNMATTNNRPAALESDGIHVTFVQSCDMGTFGESKWMSASVARDFIARGIAVESDPAPKQ